MSSGQHRNDVVNGPSRSGERETERGSNQEQSTKRNQPSAAAQTHGCAWENKKLRRNVLDGNHELARRISPTTSASVIPSGVFWKPSCARFRTDDMHPLMLRLIGHLLCTG
jgi:hypothetical protein